MENNFRKLHLWRFTSEASRPLDLGRSVESNSRCQFSASCSTTTAQVAHTFAHMTSPESTGAPEGRLPEGSQACPDAAIDSCSYLKAASRPKSPQPGSTTGPEVKEDGIIAKLEAAIRRNKAARERAWHRGPHSMMHWGHPRSMPPRILMKDGKWTDAAKPEERVLPKSERVPVPTRRRVFFRGEHGSTRYMRVRSEVSGGEEKLQFGLIPVAPLQKFEDTASAEQFAKWTPKEDVMSKLNYGPRFCGGSTGFLIGWRPKKKDAPRKPRPVVRENRRDVVMGAVQERGPDDSRMQVVLSGRLYERKVDDWGVTLRLATRVREARQLA